MKLPRSTVEALLARHPIARLATVGRDGQPHLVPVVFVHREGALWTPVDAKPKSDQELRRVRNIREHGRASLLLDAYEPDWAQLWWLRVDGEASVVEDRPATDPLLTEVVRGLREKYPQYESVPVFRDAPQLLRVTTGRVSSWCAGPLAATAAAGGAEPA